MAYAVEPLVATTKRMLQDPVPNKKRLIKISFDPDLGHFCEFLQEVFAPNLPSAGYQITELYGPASSSS